MSTKQVQPVIKILMLEDQVDDANLVDRMLRKGGIVFESLRVDDREGFENALKDFKPDVILSDHALPQFNSIEAIKVMQAKAPGTPFILVTGAVSDEFAAQCIKLGADDYILKSNLSRLPSSLKNAMEYHALEERRIQNEIALREQNARLTKANKEIDSFVYSVSHNLRAPLASILGLVNVARHDIKLPGFDPAYYFNKIENSIQKLDETIREILEYSRNERSEITSEPIDLQNLVSECLERIRYLSGFDHLEKTITISNNIPFYSDAYRLTIILLNLFSNSVKYMDETKKQSILTISISVDSEKADFKITDNGIGIAQQNMPQIFDMFYRGTEKSEGAGLGLYIVKEMVKKLGGTVVVASDQGLQTTFTISLPNLKDGQAP